MDEDLGASLLVATEIRDRLKVLAAKIKRSMRELADEAVLELLKKNGE